MTDTSNRLGDLHPVFRPIAQEIIEAVNRKIAPSSIRPTVTFRSMADQATAKAAGKSNVSLGWHQFGLAIDVAVISESGAYITNGQDERYAVFGTEAKDRGCIWGGDWISFKDWCHVEYHPGFSLDQYMAWLDLHRVTTA